MILKTLPRYLFIAITDRNTDLLVLALDMAVPPLSFLGILIVGMFFLASLAWMIGFSTAALVIATGNFLAFMIAISLAWYEFGRNVFPASSLLSIGSLIMQKLKLHGRLLLGKTASGWIRTDRE